MKIKFLRKNIRIIPSSNFVQRIVNVLRFCNIDFLLLQEIFEMYFNDCLFFVCKSLKCMRRTLRVKDLLTSSFSYENFPTFFFISRELKIKYFQSDPKGVATP